MTTCHFVIFVLIAAFRTGCAANVPEAPIDFQGGFTGATMNETEFVMLLGSEEAQGSAWSREVRRRFNIVKGSMLPFRGESRRANPQDIMKNLTSAFSGNQTYMIVDLNGTQPCTLNNTAQKIVFDVAGGSPGGTNANGTGMMLMGMNSGSAHVSGRIGEFLGEYITKGSKNVFDRTFRRGNRPKPEDILKIVNSALGQNGTYMVINLNGTQPYMLNNTMLEITTSSCKKDIGQ